MNFRRQPFQFTEIDPAKRQAELQKRFGLPSTNSDMYVDFLNPVLMNSGIQKPSLVRGSPRLQHRVPIFTENADKANPDQKNVDGSHKPRVRVVPIQVEGVDGGYRHRNFSGPAGLVSGSISPSIGKQPDTFLPLDTTKGEEKVQKPRQPRVCNIPIQIEPREEKHKGDELSKVESTSKIPEPAKKLKTELNGCAASKNKEEPDKTVPLKQIENVLNKLKVYQEEVEKFSGNSKDKQYRYLDEMLTRCMLDLDNVETMGLDEIRKARKEAVKHVQHYVDLLDTKVNAGIEMIDSEITSTDNPAADSKERELPCDITAEADSTVSPDSSQVSATNNVNVSVSEDVEMSGDVSNEVDNSYIKKIDESLGRNKVNKANVDMDGEKALFDQLPDSSNEKITKDDDGEPMDSDVTKSSGYQKQDLNLNENESPVPEAEMDSASSTKQDPELKDSENGSEIVIKELEGNLPSGSNVSCTENGENIIIPHIISSSLNLGIKEGIVEDPDSEMVTDETEEASCLKQDSELKDGENGAEIIIEELDGSLLNGFNVSSSESGENTSPSLDLGVKEGLVEKPDSEIAVEKTEGYYVTENNGSGKDVECSLNSCDSIVDKVDSNDTLTVDQLNYKSKSYGVSNNEQSSGDGVPVAHEHTSESEKR